MGFAHASTLRDASTTRDRSCQYALRAWTNLETRQLREDHSGQFHYRAKRGAQYRWDNTIDAPYRFAMPVRPEIGRARSSRNGTWKNLEKRQFRAAPGQFRLCRTIAKERDIYVLPMSTKKGSTCAAPTAREPKAFPGIVGAEHCSALRT